MTMEKSERTNSSECSNQKERKVSKMRKLNIVLLAMTVVVMAASSAMAITFPITANIEAADEATKQQAESFRAKLEGGTPLETVTWTEDEQRDAEASGKKEARPVLQTTAWILKTQEAIPRIGIAKDLHQAAFELTAEAPLAKTAYKVGNSYFVVRLKDREVPDLKEFEDQKDSLKEQALSSKRGQIFREWIDHLRSNANVELNPGLFPEANAEATNS